MRNASAAIRRPSALGGPAKAAWMMSSAERMAAIVSPPEACAACLAVHGWAGPCAVEDREAWRDPAAEPDGHACGDPAAAGDRPDAGAPSARTDGSARGGRRNLPSEVTRDERSSEVTRRCWRVCWSWTFDTGETRGRAEARGRGCGGGSLDPGGVLIWTADGGTDRICHGSSPSTKIPPESPIVSPLFGYTYTHPTRFSTLSPMSYEILQAICESREELALVTVMDTRGSVPRHAGSKMLVHAAGVFRGTVGGGKGEARAILVAKECIARKAADTLTLEFQGEQIEGPDMICGGTCLLLVEHLADREPYRRAFARLQAGERTLLVKSLGDGSWRGTAHRHPRGAWGKRGAPPWLAAVRRARGGRKAAAQRHTGVSRGGVCLSRSRVPRGEAPGPRRRVCREGGCVPGVRAGFQGDRCR